MLNRFVYSFILSIYTGIYIVGVVEHGTWVALIDGLHDRLNKIS